jgi:hypothetical protein
MRSGARGATSCPVTEPSWPPALRFTHCTQIPLSSRETPRRSSPAPWPRCWSSTSATPRSDSTGETVKTSSWRRTSSQASSTPSKRRSRRSLRTTHHSVVFSSVATNIGASTRPAPTPRHCSVWAKQTPDAKASSAPSTATSLVRPGVSYSGGIGRDDASPPMCLRPGLATPWC